MPVLTIPAISPIYGNAPSFLTVDVDAGGTIVNAEEHSFSRGRWADIGGLRSLGLSAFTAPQLLALQERLQQSPSLREIFSRLYTGAGRTEITERNWRAYWCAATELGATAFRTCAGTGGYSIFTERGLVLVAAGVLAFALVVAFFIFQLLRRARTWGAPPAD